MDADAATIPLGDFDTLWDFDDPAASAARFARVVDRARDEHEGAFHAEALTQLARAQGLQRRFAEARATLHEAERVLEAGNARGQTRILLERGRLDRTEGVEGLGRSSFLEAWDFARAIGDDNLAVDAAHMLGIVEPADEGTAWNERAMELALASADPAARRWVGSIASNMGWARHADDDFAGAIALFELARDEWLADGRVSRARIARWSIARCMRSQANFRGALVEQQALLAELEQLAETDGYVFEEIAECLLALGRSEEARPFFARAHDVLGSDPYLVADDPARIDRLRTLGAQTEP
jgi:tetratricopeptide (TPR) repeat protein